MLSIALACEKLRGGRRFLSLAWSYIFLFKDSFPARLVHMSVRTPRGRSCAVRSASSRGKIRTRPFGFHRPSRDDWSLESG